MAISYRTASHTGIDVFASSTSGTVPTGASTDDVVVAVLSRWESTNPAVTTPTGFTHAGSQITMGNPKIDIYWKRLTGADTGSYTFSWSGSMWAHLHCFCFSGVILSGDPIGSNIASWTGTAGTYGSVQLTTSFAPGLVWSTFNDDSTLTHTPPTNFTEVIDAAGGSGAIYVPGTSGTFTAANGAAVGVNTDAMVAYVALEPETGAPPSGVSVWLLDA